MSIEWTDPALISAVIGVAVALAARELAPLVWRHGVAPAWHGTRAGLSRLRDAARRERGSVAAERDTVVTALVAHSKSVADLTARLGALQAQVNAWEASLPGVVAAIVARSVPAPAVAQLTPPPVADPPQPAVAQ